MLKISYASCLGLSSAISSQFNVEMCVAAKNCEKNSPNPLFLVFKNIDVDKSKKPVTSACYDKSISVCICNRFHTRRADSGKMTSFYGGGCHSDAFVRGEPYHPGAQNFVTKTRVLGVDVGRL